VDVGQEVTFKSPYSGEVVTAIYRGRYSINQYIVYNPDSGMQYNIEKSWIVEE